MRLNLVDKEISAYIGYVPLHSSKVGINMGYAAEDLMITQEYSQRVLRLPLHNNMNQDESKYIAELIIQYIKEYRE